MGPPTSDQPDSGDRILAIKREHAQTTSEVSTPHSAATPLPPASQKRARDEEPLSADQSSQNLIIPAGLAAPSTNVIPHELFSAHLTNQSALPMKRPRGRPRKYPRPSDRVFDGFIPGSGRQFSGDLGGGSGYEHYDHHVGSYSGRTGRRSSASYSGLVPGPLMPIPSFMDETPGSEAASAAAAALAAASFLQPLGENEHDAHSESFDDSTAFISGAPASSLDIGASSRLPLLGSVPPDIPKPGAALRQPAFRPVGQPTFVLRSTLKFESAKVPSISNDDSDRESESQDEDEDDEYKDEKARIEVTDSNVNTPTPMEIDEVKDEDQPSSDDDFDVKCRGSIRLYVASRAPYAIEPDSDFMKVVNGKESSKEIQGSASTSIVEDPDQEKDPKRSEGKIDIEAGSNADDSAVPKAPLESEAKQTDESNASPARENAVVVDKTKSLDESERKESVSEEAENREKKENEPIALDSETKINGFKGREVIKSAKPRFPEWTRELEPDGPEIPPVPGFPVDQEGHMLWFPGLPINLEERPWGHSLDYLVYRQGLDDLKEILGDVVAPTCRPKGRLVDPVKMEDEQTKLFERAFSDWAATLLHDASVIREVMEGGQI